MTACILLLLFLCVACTRAALGELRADGLVPECGDLGCRVLRAAGAVRRWLDGDVEELPPAPTPPARTEAEARQQLGAAIMDAVNKRNARNIRDQCDESSDTAALNAVQMNVDAHARACSDEARAAGACE